MDCTLNGKESEHMIALKKYLNDMIEKEKDNLIIYSGGAWAEGVYKDKDVAVQMFHMSKGQFFPFHNHDAKEWIINVKGTFETEIKGKKQIIGKNESVIVLPGENHGGTALEDLWCVCITIPADEGYPNAT